VKPLKTRWEDLAIAGGVPAFEQALHVGRPNIGDRQVFMERMNSILDRRWLTNNGTYLQQFEQAVAERAGVRHCVAVCNATVALQLAARALGLTGEVIVPAFTFVATAHAMQWEGLTPVFCDVDPATMQMTPDAAEKLITERTSAMVPVHLWGRVAVSSRWRSDTG
jgi:dTDP-4-amino-4,6-dideoxygalactose transaminase